MQNRLLHSIGRFFVGTGSVLGSPSGDARGLVRVYSDQQSETVKVGRSF
jgi:hypothetical protein